MPKQNPGDATRTINFRMPIDVFERLAAAATDERRSINNMATQLIEEALDARDFGRRRARAKDAAA